MAIKVQLESNQLRFEEFPTHLIEYFKESPNSGSVMPLEVTDTRTEKILSVFLRYSDLQEIGMPLQLLKLVNQPLQFSELLERACNIERLFRKSIKIVLNHVSFKYFRFFTNIPLANRVIISFIQTKTSHLSKVKGIPGIYLFDHRSIVHLFINLKKTPPLGIGSYGKIRKALWLTAPNEDPKIVAKKVLLYKNKEDIDLFNREITVLNAFSGKRGIISMICGDFFNDKHAIFMPLYECSLFQYLKKPAFKITLDQQLDLISQWLEGLATISEKGIHGDLSASNLLIKRNGNKIEGVIADFGLFCFHNDKNDSELVVVPIASPEYYAKKMVTSKQDVWALGLSIHKMFAKRPLPCWRLPLREDRRLWTMLLWTTTLTPGWCLDSFIDTTPPFLMNLINEMLDPRPDHRPSAKGAFDYFLEGRASFAEEKTLDEEDS